MTIPARSAEAGDRGRNRSRRQFLRGVGVFLSLPVLESIRPAFAKAEDLAKPRRMLAICNNLGLLPDYFFPKEVGRGYELSPYLKNSRRTATTSPSSAGCRIRTWMGGIRRIIAS